MTRRIELPGPNDWRVVPAAGGFAVVVSPRYQAGRVLAMFAAVMHRKANNLRKRP